MTCSFAGYPERAGLWTTVRQELLYELKTRGGLYDLNADELNQFLSKIATTDEISAYLNSTQEYLRNESDPEQSCWALAHLTINHEADLYEPVTELLNDILSHFGLYDANERKVLNVLNNDPSHEPTFYSSGDITRLCPPLRVVHFDEHHFKSSRTIEDTSCIRCATPVEVRMDKDCITEEDEDEYLARCASYARFYLYHQPGRRFIYVPLFTEEHVRLYRFDRGGVVRGPWVNMHDYPGVLVRIVLLTCGQSGDILGANPALTWEGSRQYITVAGVKYEVEKELFRIHHIRSRGACVWRVFDDQGRARVVKYSWRSRRFAGDESEIEWEMLNNLKGVQGVAQILDHSEEESLWDTRGFLPQTPFHGSDRVATLTVLQCYGDRIKRFKSPLQLLEAFRDAIAGHQNMWKQGILHRDVSEGNILYGQECAKEGSRGVLIDMDRAIHIAFDETLPQVTALFGTRAFQSINVIRSELPREDDEPYHPHTYLDDLQSFLWVFIWIIVGYEVSSDGSSRPIRPKPAPLEDFLSRDPFVADSAKSYYLQNPNEIKAHESYPPQFDVLKTQLMRFFAHYGLQQPKSAEYPTLESLSVISEYHYKRILGWIDDAISDLKSDTARFIEDLIFNFTKDDLEIARLQDIRDRADAIESLAWSYIIGSATSPEARRAAEDGILRFVTELEKEPPAPTPPPVRPRPPVLTPICTRDESFNVSRFESRSQSQPMSLNVAEISLTTSSSSPASATFTRDYPVFRSMENTTRSPAKSKDNGAKLKRNHQGAENESAGGKRYKGRH